MANNTGIKYGGRIKGTANKATARTYSIVTVGLLFDLIFQLNLSSCHFSISERCAVQK